MRLVLIRHAKAEPAALGQPDLDRALTGDGRSRAAANARILAECGVRIDTALVSPSLRTRQSWAVMEPILGGKAQPAAALYHASPDTVMACIDAAAAPDQTLAVVGHNPGLAQLALDLAMEARAPRAAMDALHAGYPTASAAVFDWAEGARRPALAALVVREALIAGQ